MRHCYYPSDILRDAAVVAIVAHTRKLVHGGSPSGATPGTYLRQDLKTLTRYRTAEAMSAFQGKGVVATQARAIGKHPLAMATSRGWFALGI